MSHYDALITELRALAFKKGSRPLATEAGMHVDTLRTLLSEKPPKSVQQLKRLADISAQEQSAPGAVETVEGQPQ